MKRNVLFLTGLLLVFLFLGIADSYAQVRVSEPAQKAQTTFELSKGDFLPLPALRDEEEGIWIHYDDGSGTNAIGTNAPNIYEIAVRWDANEIAHLNNGAITKIMTFSNSVPTASFVKIYQGNSSTTLEELHSQPFTPLANDWTITELDLPIDIDISLGLWIAVRYEDPGPGVFPAGIDSQTAASGKSNLIILNPDDPSSTWGPLTDLAPSLVGDWKLRAYVEGAEPPTEPVEVTIIVTSEGAPLAGAIVELDPESGSEEDFHLGFTDETGTFSVEVTPGAYSYFVAKPGYAFSEGAFNAVIDPVEIIAALNPFDVDVPVDLAIDVDGSNATLTWDYGEPVFPQTLSENWDSYADFTTDLDPWISIDTHGNPTWGSQDFDFTGESTAFGWRIMNPATTTPAITGNHPAQSGSKYAFSVASNPVPSTGEENKWLISPRIEATADSELKFFAKSITAQYGLERMKVYVSTGGTEPSDFTKISEGNYLEVPISWTEYTFGLSAYAGQIIRFAVENVSNDAFMLFLDSFEVTNGGKNGNAPKTELEGFVIFLDDMDFPHDFIELGEEKSYTFSELEDGSYVAGVAALYEDGLSEIATINFTIGGTNVIEIQAPAYSVYPNPARTQLNMVSQKVIKDVKVFDITGRMIYQQAPADYRHIINVSEFKQGLYILQINTTDGVISHKFNVTK
jgi:hypothetical protein